MKKLKQHLPEPLRRTYRDLRAAPSTLTLPAARTFSQPEEEREASRQMSIIVPVKNSAGVAQRCFGSLERFAPYAEVIVVDDGSQLPETQRLFDDFCGRNHWTVIHHRQSQGHSRACEAGVQRSTRPYLCLLNSDTVATPWSWLAAQQAFEGDPTIGVTGPCTSHSATPQMLRKAMHCRHYWDDDQICAFASAHLSTVSPRSWVDIEQAGGFAFFIRRSLWMSWAASICNCPTMATSRSYAGGCRSAVSESSGPRIATSIISESRAMGGCSAAFCTRGRCWPTNTSIANMKPSGPAARVWIRLAVGFEAFGCSANSRF